MKVVIVARNASAASSIAEALAPHFVSAANATSFLEVAVIAPPLLYTNGGGDGDGVEDSEVDGEGNGDGDGRDDDGRDDDEIVFGGAGACAIPIHTREMHTRIHIP